MEGKTDTLMTKRADRFVPNQYPLHIEALVAKRLSKSNIVKRGYDLQNEFNATLTDDGAIDFNAIVNTNKFRFERGLVTSIGEVSTLQNKRPGLLFKVTNKHMTLDEAMKKAEIGQLDYGFFYEKLANLFNIILAVSAENGFCHNNLHAGNVLVDLSNDGDLQMIDYSLAFVDKFELKDVISTFNNLGQSEFYNNLCLTDTKETKDTKAYDIWKEMYLMNPFVKGFIRDTPQDKDKVSMPNWFLAPNLFGNTNESSNSSTSANSIEIDRFAVWVDLAGLILYLMINYKGFYTFIESKINGPGRGNKLYNNNRFTSSKLPIVIKDGSIESINASSAQQILESKRVDSINDAIAIATLLINKFKFMANITSDKHLIPYVFENKTLANRYTDPVLNADIPNTFYNNKYNFDPMLKFVFFDTGVINPYMYFKCMDHGNLRAELLSAFKLRNRISPSSYSTILTTPSSRQSSNYTELLTYLDTVVSEDTWTETLNKKHELDTMLFGNNNNDVLVTGLGISVNDNAPAFVECKDAVKEEKMLVLDALRNSGNASSTLFGGGKRTHIVIKEKGKRINRVRKVRVDPDTGARFIMLEGVRVLLSEVRGRYRYVMHP